MSRSRKDSEGSPPILGPQEALRALGAVIEDGEELLSRSATSADVDIDEFDVWHGGAIATARAALGERHLLASRLSVAGDLLVVLGGDEDFPPDHFRNAVQKALQYLREALKLIGRGVVAEVHPPATFQARDVTVNVHHAPGAIVNVGHIFGEVRTGADVLAAEGHSELATALREVADAVRHHVEVGNEAKRDVAEFLAVLAEQARLPRDQRRSAVIRSVLEQIPRALSTASDLGTVWSTWGPLISGYFAS